MNKYLEPFNMFGHKINFNYKNSKAFYSLFGLFISFVVFSLVAFLLYYFSEDFVYMKNPKLNFKQKQFTDKNTSLAHFLDSEELKIKFKIGKINDNAPSDKNSTKNGHKDENNFNFEEYIVKNNFTVHHFLRSEIVIEEEIESKQDPDVIIGRKKILNFHFFDDVEITNDTIYIYQKIDNNSSFSLSQSNDEINITENKEIIEYFDSFNEFYFIVNKSTKILSRLLIDHEFLSNENLFIESIKFERTSTIIDKLIDVDNINFFTNVPYKKLSGRNMKIFDVNNYGRHEYTFTPYEVLDDAGVILSKPIRRSGFVKESDSSPRKIYNPQEGINYSAIRFNSVRVDYDRIYKKLQNIFADIGGIFSSLILIGNLLVGAYNQKYFCYQTMNFLYENEDNEINSSNQKALIKIKHKEFNNNNDQYFNNNKDNIKFDETHFSYVNSNNKLDKNDFSPFQETNKKNNELFNNMFRNGKEIVTIADKKFVYESNHNDNTDNNIKCEIQKEASRICNETRSIFSSRNFNNSIDCMSENNHNKNNTDSSKIENNLKNHKKIELSKLDFKQKNDFQIKNNLRAKIAELVKENSHGANNTNNFFNNIKLKGNKKYVKFSRYEYFLSSICFNKFKNQQLIDKEKTFYIAENKINTYLNVLNYFDFYEDFEKLKSLILNENLNFAFKFLKKRTLNDLSESNYSEKIFKMINYFKENETNFTYLDEKLLDNLNFKIIELIRINNI